MKKFLVIIILGFLWNGNAYANVPRCNDILDVNWKWEEIFEGKTSMHWTFKNESNHNIIITEVGLKSKDGKIMRSEKPWHKPYVEGESYPIGEEDFYLKPFGVTNRIIVVWDLNLDVAGNGFYTCKHGTKPVATNQTNSSSSSSKSKQKSGSSGSSKSLLKKLLGKD